MKKLVECVLYTHESALLARMNGLLALQAEICHMDSSEELLDWIGCHPESVVLLDARDQEYDELLKALLAHERSPVLIVLGVAHSEPLRFAESMGAYAVIGLAPELPHFKMLMSHALAQTALLRQNRHLKEELAREKIARSVQRQQWSQGICSSAVPFHNFSRTLKNFDNISQLYASVMESFVESAKVTRAGLFCSIGGGGYCFRSGVRCRARISELNFSARDPFVRWLTLNGFLVSRQTIGNLKDPVVRDMLQQHLDLFGAELIIPIQCGEMISGWIFVGPRITGVPFEYEDLEALTSYADHIAKTLFNALKHQQTSLQKVLAETVLHSIPLGLTAIRADGAIQWMNQKATEIFKSDFEEMLGLPVEMLSSQVADVLRRALGGAEVCTPVEWRDPATRRLLSIESRQLISESRECIGAVALIKDVTHQRLLEEKEELLERTAFWTELAASMSHEIRNPLVAIKTFAQLLPERFEDEEFRQAFSHNVATEVSRLNSLVDQIHQFAHPPSLKFTPVKISSVIEHAVKEVKKQVGQEIAFATMIDQNVPVIEGDERALEEGLTHLLLNCAEALDGAVAPQVKISADARCGAEGQTLLQVRVNDNGKGISAEDKHQLFSPFYTTKAQGMGLGLSIVKRTALDHNGRVDLANTGDGFQVTLSLPFRSK